MQILWPAMSSSNTGDDLWGNKFWDATFENENAQSVEVSYSGFFSDMDGKRSFNELGKCKVPTSKSSLVKNWTVRY